MFAKDELAYVLSDKLAPEDTWTWSQCLDRDPSPEGDGDDAPSAANPLAERKLHACEFTLVVFRP